MSSASLMPADLGTVSEFTSEGVNSMASHIKKTSLGRGVTFAVDQVCT